MHLRRNTTLGKVKKFYFLTILFIFYSLNSSSEDNLINEKFAEINILDKVSSKSSNIKIEIGKELIFQNLIIKINKCNNSKFDDDPEVTAHMQVRDLSLGDKDKVFIFNGWTFASSPSIRPFDHPVYDIWLKKCYT
tara:strand:- start:339 stop:746 length:408 start_codon:yes stop_codon:yes gene_type:complete